MNSENPPKKSKIIKLIGHPNSGKSSLFNLLTGGKQKVANYPGVTVEKKVGVLKCNLGQVKVIDLPGTYSLNPHSEDEMVTVNELTQFNSEENELILCVLDSSKIETGLRFALEILSIKKPVIFILNMSDVIEKEGFFIDNLMLYQQIGYPFLKTSVTKNQGISDLIRHIFSEDSWNLKNSSINTNFKSIEDQYTVVNQLIKLSYKSTENSAQKKSFEITDSIDNIVLSPIWGPLILIFVLAITFQAVFTWAAPLQDEIENLVNLASTYTKNFLPPSWYRDLLTEGVLSGVGSVVVFMPQILLLFLFIMILEDSGYMSRTAFMLDKLMRSVGLHGKAIIPLLSSHACAIPGIMSTRIIENKRDRLATIAIAPIMTCSARLPVYSMLIAAFVPAHLNVGPLSLQAATLLFLYIFAIISALLVAFFMKTTFKNNRKTHMIFELPSYKFPSIKFLAIGLYQRASLFIKKAGTTILFIMVGLWCVTSFPQLPKEHGFTHNITQIEYSFAGRLAHLILPLLKPLGFDLSIVIALIPGFAAREVMVGALGTVYAVNASGNQDTSALLSQIISQHWTAATGFSLLAWYVFAPQCISTIVAIKKETYSLKLTLFVVLYLFILAYIAAFLTHYMANWFLN